MIRDSIIMEMGGHKFSVPPLLFVAGWIHFVGELAPFEAPGGEWYEQTMPLPAMTEHSLKPALYSVETMCKVLSTVDDWTLADDPGFVERNKAVFVLAPDGRAKLTGHAIDGWAQIPAQVQQVMLTEVDALAFPVMMAHGSSQD